MGTRIFNRQDELGRFSLLRTTFRLLTKDDLSQGRWFVRVQIPVETVRRNYDARPQNLVSAIYAVRSYDPPRNAADLRWIELQRIPGNNHWARVAGETHAGYLLCTRHAVQSTSTAYIGELYLTPIEPPTEWDELERIKSLLP